VNIRKLNPDSDKHLIREALSWTDAQPLFYRNCDSAWGVDDLDKYLEMMRTDPQVDVGVFEDDVLVSVITIELAAKDVYKAHLMVRKGTSPDTVKQAAMSVMTDLFDAGLKEGWALIAEKNLGARKVLESIGMRRDGIERIRGVSHKRPIKWLRYSVTA
jgi:hypothetical protein